jgi:hypothetical protein
VALSGPIAKAIQDGEPEGSFIRSSYDKMAHDMSLAEACCRLLPFRHEIFHLADKTEHLLRTCSRSSEQKREEGEVNEL